jgi:hypothetical protein
MVELKDRNKIIVPEPPKEGIVLINIGNKTWASKIIILSRKQTEQR